MMFIEISCIVYDPACNLKRKVLLQSHYLTNIKILFFSGITEQMENTEVRYAVIIINERQVKEITNLYFKLNGKRNVLFFFW